MPAVGSANKLIDGCRIPAHPRLSLKNRTPKTRQLHPVFQECLGPIVFVDGRNDFLPPALIPSSCRERKRNQLLAVFEAHQDQAAIVYDDPIIPVEGGVRRRSGSLTT